MKDIRIGADNFLEIFRGALVCLTLRTGECCPLTEFDHVGMYMLGIASCLGLVIIDNTVGAQTYLRLTPLGKRWLENPMPLADLKARAPSVVE